MRVPSGRVVCTESAASTVVVDVAGLLDAGADDAVAIDSPTLAARLHAATRRARTINAGTRISIGDIVYDRESRRVWCAGAEVALTPTEESVLDCLFWYSPRAVDVRTLIAHVWREELTPGNQRLARVYIGYVRSKLDASEAVSIRNLRGVGYALAPR